MWFHFINPDANITLKVQTGFHPISHQKKVPCGLQSAMLFLMRDTMPTRTVIGAVAVLNAWLTNVLLQD
jgi:hypothetical protein